MVDINDESHEQSRLCAEQHSANPEAAMGVPENNGSTKGSCCESFTEMMSDSPIGRYGREFFTKKNALRKFPIVKWAPKYRVKHFVGDLVAGLTVGLTVIPQGLAYALVAELPPQYGLYSAFMGVLVYTFFGTSKDITLGPTAIMSLLIAEFASEKAPHGYAAVYAIVLTLMCGVIQFLMGMLNMGFIVQFISFPVISGFTSSAAIIIAFGQIKKWLGLHDVPRDFKQQFVKTFQKIPETNLSDFGMGLGCMIILVAMKYLKEFADRRMKTETNKSKKALFKVIWLLCTARNAVVVILTAGIASILKDIYNIDKLTLTDPIDGGFLAPAVPKFSIDENDTASNHTIHKTAGEIFSDIGEGFAVVALIGLLESIAIAKAFARRNEYQIDANQELIAIGIANAVSCFFHSYPVTGSFSRTAINSQSGARTPASGIWTGAIVILSLAVLTPYFAYIPQAALAAVIICAVLQMVDYEILPVLWRVKKLDLVPLFLTFIVCILVNIEYGIMAGVGFSVLILVFPMARPGLKVSYEKSTEDAEGGHLAHGKGEVSREAVILEPNQGLKFPGVEYIKDKAMKHGVFEEPQKAIILNARHFAGCDYTMVQGITQVTDYFSKHKLKFIMACCSAEVREVLEAAAIKDLAFADSVDEALDIVFAGGDQLAEGENGAINAGFMGESSSSLSTNTATDNKDDLV